MIYSLKNYKAFYVLLLIVLCSCNVNSGNKGNITPNDNFPDRFTSDEYKIATFNSGVPNDFWMRNDRGNGHPFNCSFSKENVVIDEGVMDLYLTKTEIGYAGAELFSTNKYSYGFYSVSMKAVKCSGVISSFFTYTGHPWDEIDIEFLGDDTTNVQFNHYTNGVGGHEYLYDLGFDASEDYHEYAFDWQEDCIVYYVDGKAVYKTNDDIPSTSGQIMMNIWNVADSNANWAGKFEGDSLPVNSSYKWIGYQCA